MCRFAGCLTIMLLLIWGSCSDSQHKAPTEDSEQNSTEGIVQDSPFSPEFILQYHDPEKTDDGITLFAVQGGEETFEHPYWVDFGYMAAIPMAANGRRDDEILPIWIFADFDGGPFSFLDLLSDGRILTMRGAQGGELMSEIDPHVPETVFTYDDVMMNHFATILPDGNLLGIWSEFTDHETYGYDFDEDGDKEIRTESIRVLTPEGEALWDWSVFENDPDAPVTEQYVTLTEWWSNCNAVSFTPTDTWTEGDPLEGDIYLNCRLLNRLYDIEYPSGEIRWIMGDGGDFGEGFFYHSHDPHISFDRDKSGERIATRILLYDNREAPPLGNAEPCPPDETCKERISRYSRVIEVVADADLNAEIVWKWPSPSEPDFDDYHFYSPIGGGVTPLGNGNILITNATEGGNPYLNDVVRGRLLEVVPDGSLTGAEVVWDVAFNKNYGSYRAIRLPKDTTDAWRPHLIPPNPNE